MNNELCIIGAGGIGCAVGYGLRAAGVPVTFVDVDRDKVEWGRANGVCVDRRAPCPAEFLTFEEWEPGPGATLLLCTKCYENDRVLSRLPVAADPPVALIPIQNGFDRSLESRGDGWEGIASFVSECLPNRTHTRITRAGRLHFGRRCSQRDSSATKLPLPPLGGESRGEEASNPAPVQVSLRGYESEEKLRSLLLEHARGFARLGIKIEMVADILPFKYTKLMYNAAISPLAAAAGLDNGQLLSVPKARRLFFNQLRENYAILHGAGITLGKIGPFHPASVERILHRPALANALAWAFYPTLRKSYCSMAGDLPRGRTEIDYYNRRLIDLAGDRPCPCNRQVYQLIKRMERERIPPGVHVLDELL